MRPRLLAGLSASALVAGLLTTITIAPAFANAATTVDSVNFNDSTTGDWTLSGSPTLTYVDDGNGGKALDVGNRTADYVGIQSPTGLLEPGITYTLSMRVRLADPGIAETPGVRFVVKPAYSWVGNTTMNSATWSTVTGTYTPAAGSDPSTINVYIGTADLATPAAYDYLVDDISITKPVAPVTVSSVNFDDSTTGDWIQDGSPTALTYVDDGNGGKALDVQGRNQDFDGIQSPTNLLQAGITYTMSMRVKLADPASTETPSVRFVINDGSFTWATGSNTAINATTWTTVSGTYQLIAGADPTTTRVYIGTDNNSSSTPYDYLVDDISITKPGDTTPPPAADVTVSGLDFENGSYTPWTQNGSPTGLTVVDDGTGTNNVLDVQGRANNWDGIQAPTGLLQPNVTYAFSMKVKLVGVAETPAVGFVVNNNGSYTHVGDTAANSTGWTTISGNYTVPDGSDPAQIQVYLGTADLTTSAPYEYLVDDISITAPAGTYVPFDKKFDFEDGTLQGWAARGGDADDPTVGVTTVEAHGGTQAALVSNRTSEGDGLGYDVTNLFNAGGSYNISAWVKFATGTPTGDFWMSTAITSGGSTNFTQAGQFSNVTASGWTQVTAKFQMPTNADNVLLYFETKYQGGNTSDFLVDDIEFQAVAPATVQTDIDSLKDDVPFPVGAALNSTETTGPISQLFLKHFDQLTPENSMKPEGWYTSASTNWDNRVFQINPDAKALMDFAQANNVRVYGHNLVWHSQTPDWFFQDDAGNWLTNSPADQDIMRQRLHDHIFAVAQALSSAPYGLFGSSTNPLVAFDVVNEVVSDGTNDPDGLRQSHWYQILGEEFIEDAFNDAEQAFNVTYADPGAARPIKLAINDYNTEQSGKRQRLHDLVTRLIADNVPVDIVGHQFHVAMSTPIQSLDDALTAFEDLPVKQAVTEMDVPTGTPVTQALLIDQGYYYKQAFDVFRAHAADIFSVSVWGMTDDRSWKASSGAPLLFDADLQAKPALFGAEDGTLPAQIRTANVFEGDVALGTGSTTSDEWAKLPLIPISTVANFQLRWEADHLTAYVAVNDTTPDPTDAVEFTVNGTDYTFNRDGTGDVSGDVTETANGWTAVVHLPLTAAAQGDLVTFNVNVTDGATTTSWDVGGDGSLSLIEPMSYTDVVGASTAPNIDGNIDPVWATANAVSTGKFTLGTSGATANVKTLWKDDTLYVLAQVADPTLDATASDPWQKDSVEIYVDPGNAKNGGYRNDEDVQLRINYQNELSFGTGDEAYQTEILNSATKVVAGGYVVEAAIKLPDGTGGLGAYEGMDFQVNDASGGARTSIVNWADPTGLGYQSTAHWGVGHLVAAAPTPPPPSTPPAPPAPTPTRIAGGDRIGTAIAASQTLFPNPGTAGAVVIARSDSYPDAMVGIPLAAAKNAPLLFAQGGTLSAATQSEIRRLLTPGGTVYLLGGTTALPDSVASTVTQLGFKPVRYSGADRYATSLAVAQALGNPSTVLLATGNNFPDALAAGAAAAHLHGVVLLTTGGTLSTAVQAYLTAHPGTVYTVGGPAAAAYPAGTALVGKDRYDTAAKVAAALFSSPSTLGIASGATFADALSGGAFEAIMGGPMLLTDPSSLPDSTRNYLGVISSSLGSSTLFGGTNAVTPPVQQALNTALGG